MTNHGKAPDAYFVDGRTTADGIYNLPSLTSPDSQAPLTFNDNFPEYLVPSQTSSRSPRPPPPTVPSRS